MKSLFHFILPPRGSRSFLPFVLVPVLAGMAVVQLAAPQHTELPSGGSVAQIGVIAMPDAPLAVIALPTLAARDLFAPSAKPTGQESPADPLNGAVIAGVVQKAGLRLGIVQQAGGKLRYVAVGGTIAGWRLVELGKGEARLTRGHGLPLVVAYGAHASPLKNLNPLPTTEGG